MKNLLLCFFVSFSLHAMEKNELSEEDKNLLRSVHALPNELKEKIIHHIHEEHYVEELDSYVMPRFLPKYDIYDQRWLYWTLLRKQNSIRPEEDHFIMNKIPFDVNNVEKECREVFAKGPIAITGPNKQGLVMFENSAKFYRFAYNEAPKYIDRYYISCLHPTKNKAIGFSSGSKADYSIFGLSFENNKIEEEFRVDFFKNINALRYLENKEDNYLIANCRDEILKIDIAAIKKGEDPQKCCETIIQTTDFSAQELSDRTSIKTSYEDQCVLKSIQFCKKIPSLFLVVIEFENIGRKSFLCDLNSQKKVIKAYDGLMGFLQPIDTLVCSLHRGCYTRLPKKLLSIIQRKELIQKTMAALDEQVNNMKR